MSTTSNLAKNLWPLFSCPRPTLPTPLTFNMPPTPSLLRSVSPPLPSTPLHELTLPQHLSPAIASPCLSEIKVHSHCTQEQEDSSKIEKYNTAPITKPPQAQDHHNTSDNSNNNLLSLSNSDNNPGNKSDFSDHTVHA